LDSVRDMLEMARGILAPGWLFPCAPKHVQIIRDKIAETRIDGRSGGGAQTASSILACREVPSDPFHLKETQRMALWSEYRQPTSLDDALSMLRMASGDCAILAGGTDLLLDMQQGRHPAVHTMVDVSAIAELRQIRLEAEWVFIGAAVTHQQILAHPMLQHVSACLVEACGLIGSPQVRNVATIGGNVAHALPAGDGTIALIALGAEAQIAALDGRRWEPVESLFLGPGNTRFDRSREILTGFRFRPVGHGEGSAFLRVMRPQGVAIAILNMAAWMRRAADGSIEDLRLAVGPAGPTPLRARKTEVALRGKRLEEQALRLAQEALREEARFRTSPHRATEEYRQHLAPLLLQKLLFQAMLRAKAAQTPAP
jgi:CO/xanthine dehydrogenase FAD-binding subunit